MPETRMYSLYFFWHRNGGLRRLNASFLSTVPILVKYLRRRALQSRAQHTPSLNFPFSILVSCLCRRVRQSPVQYASSQTFQSLIIPQRPQLTQPLTTSRLVYRKRRSLSSNRLQMTSSPDTLEPRRPSVFISRRFLCSLGIGFHCCHTAFLHAKCPANARNRLKCLDLRTSVTQTSPPSPFLSWTII